MSCHSRFPPGENLMFEGRSSLFCRDKLHRTCHGDNRQRTMPKLVLYSERYKRDKLLNPSEISKILGSFAFDKCSLHRGVMPTRLSLASISTFIPIGSKQCSQNIGKPCIYNYSL